MSETTPYAESRGGGEGVPRSEFIELWGVTVVAAGSSPNAHPYSVGAFFERPRANTVRPYTVHTQKIGNQTIPDFYFTYKLF